MNRLNQLHLASWQIQRSARRRFAHHIGDLTDEHDRNVRRFCEIHSFLKTRGRFVFDLAALCITDPGLRRHLRLYSSKWTYCVFLFAVAGPPTERRAAIVREWSNYGDRAGILTQRQRLAIILQQHHRAPCDFARQTNALGPQQRRWFACLVSIGTIEKAEPKLDPQDTSYRFVNRRC